MAPIWQVRVKDSSGVTVAVLDRWTSLHITPTVNAPGAYEISMLDQRDGLAELFELDGQVEFWRRDVQAGIAWYKEFEGFHRDLSRWVDEEGVNRFSSRGLGYIDLLARRIVAAYSGSAEGAKSGPAETVIKEYVDEQAGPSAGARAIPGLSVEADAGGGNNITLARSYRNLLEVCQNISEIAGGDFDVVGTGAATWEFRWYDGQLGTDRRGDILFSLGLGNMAVPQYSLQRSEEVNAVLVGGQNEGIDRETVWRENATFIADSAINRREAFVDARDLTTMAGLISRGDARLSELRPLESFTFTVLQTAAVKYGRDYFLGDLVRAEFADIVTDVKIVGVVFTVDAGQEQLEVVLRDA